MRARRVLMVATSKARASGRRSPDAGAMSLDLWMVRRGGWTWTLITDSCAEHAGRSALLNAPATPDSHVRKTWLAKGYRATLGFNLGMGRFGMQLDNLVVIVTLLALL